MSGDGMQHHTDALAEYAVGALSGPELARVEAHLPGCASCRAALLGWTAVAAATVAPLLGRQAPAAWPATPVEAWLLDAVARRKLADHEAAARSLERALDLAVTEGHRRPFFEGGPPVRALLADHLYRDAAHGPLVKELLAGLLTQVPAPAALVGAAPALPAPVAGSQAAADRPLRRHPGRSGPRRPAEQAGRR